MYETSCQSRFDARYWMLGSRILHAIPGLSLHIWEFLSQGEGQVRRTDVTDETLTGRGNHSPSQRLLLKRGVQTDSFYANNKKVLVMWPH